MAVQADPPLRTPLSHVEDTTRSLPNAQSFLSLHSLHSTHSNRSLHSLRDIPVVVDDTFDSGTFGSERSSLQAVAPAFLSTPRQFNQQPITPSQIGTNTQPVSLFAPPDAIEESPPTPPRDTVNGTDCNSLAELHRKTTCGVKKINMWAPVAYEMVITAVVYSRAVSALGMTLAHIGPSWTVEPQSFALQYHQLRDQYAPILEKGVLVPPTPTMKIAWEHRQLIESFVTLLRTSPGFIASAFSRLAPAEVAAFCQFSSESPLAILFHHVLGDAQPIHRAVFCGELVASITAGPARRTLLVALVDRFLAETIGKKLNPVVSRYIKQRIARSSQRPAEVDLASYLCPEPLARFYALLPDDAKSMVQEKVRNHVRRVLTAPHRWGICVDIYLSESQRRDLQSIAVDYDPQIQTPDNDVWSPDELVVLKGSDIPVLVHSLLPFSVSDIGESGETTKDGDEWCLDNIRSDLLPVAREIAHTPGLSVNWFLFRLGSDGLAMEFRIPSAPEVEDPVVAALTENLDLGSAASLADARGDRLAAQQLRIAAAAAGGDISKANSAAMMQVQSRLSDVLESERALHGILDASVSARNMHSARLQCQLVILDAARIQVWYEYEARLSASFLRSRTLVAQLWPDNRENLEESTQGTSSVATNLSTVRSRRLSLLSSSHQPEPMTIQGLSNKLIDKEVDAVLLFMRRYRVANLLPADELIHRFHAEVALLARKLVDRDSLGSTSSFRRDVQSQGGNVNHRRSSLGLFDLFESAPPPAPATSTRGLPTLATVTTLLLTDWGVHQSDTDKFMGETGRMLLEGDGSEYEGAIADIALEPNPWEKMKGIEILVKLAQSQIAQQKPDIEPSRAEISHELAKNLGRNGSSFFGDLQTVAAHAAPHSGSAANSFQDVSAAARSILESTCLRAMDLADRILRYHAETTAPVVASAGIADGVRIWVFCARMGRVEAQNRLADLYMQHPHTTLDVRPLTHAGHLLDEPGSLRDAVIRYWLS